jgi:hypothetical protein
LLLLVVEVLVITEVEAAVLVVFSMQHLNHCLLQVTRSLSVLVEHLNQVLLLATEQ